MLSCTLVYSYALYIYASRMWMGTWSEALVMLLLLSTSHHLYTTSYIQHFSHPLLALAQFNPSLLRFTSVYICYTHIKLHIIYLYVLYNVYTYAKIITIVQWYQLRQRQQEQQQLHHHHNQHHHRPHLNIEFDVSVKRLVEMLHTGLYT